MRGSYNDIENRMLSFKAPGSLTSKIWYPTLFIDILANGVLSRSKRGAVEVLHTSLCKQSK